MNPQKKWFLSVPVQVPKLVLIKVRLNSLLELTKKIFFSNPKCSVLSILQTHST